MAGQLKEVRNRIKSVQSTQQITKAMKMVSAAKLRRAQDAITQMRPYAQKLQEMLSNIVSNIDSGDVNIKLATERTVEKVLLIVITSDRGLAGGYNANALKKANTLAADLERDGREVVRYVIGRKGVAFYRFRQIPVAGSWTGFSEQPSFANIRELTEQIGFALQATSEGEYRDEPGVDELYIVYTQFTNSVTQTAVSQLLAPVKDAVDEAEDGKDGDDDGSAENESSLPTVYEFEPEANRLLDALLPRYISARIFSALLESAASESAARRRAMKSASDNATDLIRTFTRLANQARQAEITQEISEIVGGADALAAAGVEE